MKALGIIIHEIVRTDEDVADLLDHIAEQLRDGMTSGYHPDWELTDVTVATTTSRRSEP